MEHERKFMSTTIRSIEEKIKLVDAIFKYVKEDSPSKENLLNYLYNRRGTLVQEWVDLDKKIRWEEEISDMGTP